jgi:hypothetical protein
MKSLSLTLLVATVAAEAGYTCTSETWANYAKDVENDTTALDAAATAADCLAAGKAIAEADKTADVCAFSITTAEIVEDKEASVDARAAEFSCTVLIEGGDDADIREARATEDTITYDAWAWK